LSEDKLWHTAALMTVLVIGAALVMAWGGCGDDDDDDDAGCSDNRPPEVTDIRMTVDGELIYDGYNIQPGQKVTFYLDYNDPDCNMSGGEVYLNWNKAGYYSVIHIGADSGCSGSYPDTPLAFTETLHDLGEYSFVIGVTDGCNHASDTLSGTLTVSYPPAITKVYWQKSTISAGETANLNVWVCDDDADLPGGEIIMYVHDEQAPLSYAPPVPWNDIWDDVITESVDGCENHYRALVPVIIPSTQKEDLCVDVNVTDGMGNSSGRFYNLDEPACITVN